jgi:hypothetical protein
VNNSKTPFAVCWVRHHNAEQFSSQSWAA